MQADDEIAKDVETASDAVFGTDEMTSHDVVATGGDFVDGQGTVMDTAATDAAVVLEVTTRGATTMPEAIVPKVVATTRVRVDRSAGSTETTLSEAVKTRRWFLMPHYLRPPMVVSTGSSRAATIAEFIIAVLVDNTEDLPPPPVNV